MSRQEIVILAIVAALVGLAGNLSFADELLMEAEEKEARVKRAIHSPRELAKHQATLIASCLNGQTWFYTCPHTGATLAVFCDLQTISTPSRSM